MFKPYEEILFCAPLIFFFALSESTFLPPTAPTNMKKIGLLSDTHSYMDDRIKEHLKDCDEIWHAGDIGDISVIEELETITKVRAVFGNIDTGGVRQEFEEDLRFEVEGLKVYITHIGGYPGRYSKRVKPHLDENPPGLFITGHSHILKVMMDKKRGFLHMNPGACGQHGFHKVRTLLKFNIEKGIIKDAGCNRIGGKEGLIRLSNPLDSITYSMVKDSL